MLLDTHVVIWALTDDPKLGPKSRHLISSCNRQNPFRVSAITAWEIAMLVKKGRLDLGLPAQDWLTAASQHSAWQTRPIDNAIALESVHLPGTFHNDPADCFIIATARLDRLALLTADQAILDYGKMGHVNVLNALD
jgi:PIN domain nuclease of toxin-antitoxin system